MDPLSGLSNKMEMQVKIKQRQGRLVFPQHLFDKISVSGFVPEEDLYSLNPRLVDFPLADIFIAVAQVQANKAYQLVIRTCCGSLSKKWNRHEFLVLFCRAERARRLNYTVHQKA